MLLRGASGHECAHRCGYALVVDAKNDKVKAFYQHYGFKACQDVPLTLYLQDVFE